MFAEAFYPLGVVGPCSQSQVDELQDLLDLGDAAERAHYVLQYRPLDSDHLNWNPN